MNSRQNNGPETGKNRSVDTELQKKERESEPTARIIFLKDHNGSGEQPISSYEAACYIHDLAKELKVMAESAHLNFLAHLLDMVVEESAMQRRGRC